MMYAISLCRSDIHDPNYPCFGDIGVVNSKDSKQYSVIFTIKGENVIEYYGYKSDVCWNVNDKKCLIAEKLCNLVK